MSTITATDINKLRQATGAGMSDCKKALLESNGDFYIAIDYLRKKGQKIAASRSDREAKEGIVIAQVTNDKKNGYIICLSCETDFVSKNDEFIKFAQSIMDVAIRNKINSLDTLLNTPLDNATIGIKITEQMARIGEKIELTRFEKIEAPLVVPYIHGANRIGVLVALDKHSESLQIAAKDIAMQIAAMKPLAIDENSISTDIIEREKGVIMEQMKNDPKMSNKPENQLENIANGKLNAFFKENTLLNQSFVKDNSKTVKAHLYDIDNTTKITNFKRVALGG
ncbi:MAG: translation elongation factor Ts [Chitinophagaceae bacterium]